MVVPGMCAKIFKGDYFKFAKDSVLLMVSGTLQGGLFFVVHLYLNRSINGETYTVVASLLALLRVMNVPSTALTVALARYVSEFKHANNREVWVTIIKRAIRRLLLLGSIALLVWVALSGIIRAQLDVPSRLSIVVLGVVAFVNLFSPVVGGALQGCKMFKWMAASSITDGLFRVGLCIAAVLLFGSQVSPLLAAAAGSGFLALAVGFWPLKKLLASVKVIEGYDTKHVYKYLWPVVAGQGMVFLLMELDLILAPRFLEKEVLAAYGKAAMLSRCVFMITQPVAMAMFPRAVVSRKSMLVVGPLLFSFVVSSVAALFVFFFPQIPIKIFCGHVEPLYLELAKIYIWAGLPFSMLSIMTPYLWARDRHSSVLWLLPVVLLYVVLRVFFSDTPQQMILCLGVALWVAVSVLGYIMYRVLKESGDESGEGGA